MTRQLVSVDSEGRLWDLCLVALLAGTGLGVLLPIVSSVMKERGHGIGQIGLVTVGYFVAHGAGAWSARGPRGRAWTQFSLVAGLLVAAAASCTFQLQEQLGWWFVNRALAGLGMGAYMSAAQTALLRLGSSSSRGRISAAYASSFAIGFALGPPLGLWSYTISPSLPFTLASAALWLAAMVAGLLTRVSAGHPVLESAGERSRPSLLPHASVFAYAFAESTLFAMFPTFWLEEFSSVRGLGTALALFVVGSLVGALPIGWISDWFGRALTLAACAAGGALALLLLPSLASGATHIVVCLASGALVGSTYPLALALLGDTVGDTAAGSAGFTSAFSVGAILGPLSTTLAMKWFGHHAVFAPTAALLLGLAVYACVQRALARRASEVRDWVNWSHDYEKNAE